MRTAGQPVSHPPVSRGMQIFDTYTFFIGSLAQLKPFHSRRHSSHARLRFLHSYLGPHLLRS